MISTETRRVRIDMIRSGHQLLHPTENESYVGAVFFGSVGEKEFPERPVFVAPEGILKDYSRNLTDLGALVVVRNMDLIDKVREAKKAETTSGN